MSELSVEQILSMTDKELIDALMQNVDVPKCRTCQVLIQESVTGCRIIVDDQGNKHEYCSDCYFSYKPFQDAVVAFLARSPVAKGDPFAGYF